MIGDVRGSEIFRKVLMTHLNVVISIVVKVENPIDFRVTPDPKFIDVLHTL